MSELELLLENWVMYMQGNGHKLGYPSQSLGMFSGGSSGADEFEIMCEQGDIILGRAMDGIIDSITHLQRSAVNHVWLKVSHHYPTHESDYCEALTSIEVLAKKRGLFC